MKTQKNMTQEQVLIKALWSAIHCPDHMAEAFSKLAQETSKGLSKAQVERCKAAALTIIIP